MGNHKTILLVEDNLNDQFFFKAAIKKIENTSLFYIANNGQEALTKLENSMLLPDIIFTDINMPLMDGIEYLTELKKIRHTQNIPVVVLSGDTSKISDIKALGANAFIEKPNNFLELYKRINRVINLNYTINSTGPAEIFDLMLESH